MTQRLWKEVALVCLRVGLGAVLLVAGIVKIADPLAFVGAVESFALVPSDWSLPVAVYLPWLEALTGGLLICGLWTRSSALVAVVMFAGFIGAMLINLARGANVACGCFGSDPDGSSLLVSIGRTCGLLLVSVMLLRQHRDPWLSVDHALGAEGEKAEVDLPGTQEDVFTAALRSRP